MPCAGLVLPILGALPDSLIIIASGLGGTAEEAQEQVLRPRGRRCAWTLRRLHDAPVG